MFDEPANGLDPEGIHWIRQLFRTLARKAGRLCSSDLMSEMALTADQLIIIGRGLRIADTPMDHLVESRGRRDVLVRSPRAADLVTLLTAHGATVTPDPAGGLGRDRPGAPAIADLAAAHGLPVHELVPRHPSLEDAYLDITCDATQHRAAAPAGEGAAVR